MFFTSHHVSIHLRKEFPHLPPYQRCVELMPCCAVVWVALFEALKGECPGTTLTDSTPIAVCDNLRIYRRVFKGIAPRGKSSKGRFVGSP